MQVDLLEANSIQVRNLNTNIRNCDEVFIEDDNSDCEDFCDELLISNEQSEQEDELNHEVLEDLTII